MASLKSLSCWHWRESRTANRQAATNVGQVVVESCQRLRPAAEGKQLAFETQVSDASPLLAHVDSADLADCVNHLIDNAIKYTPAGGRVTVRVLSGSEQPCSQALPPPPRTAAGRSPSDYVYVIVQDTGIGLGDSVALLENGTPAAGSIFDAFRRGDAALSAGIPGTGLGLSIVREVVRQAGGYIHVRSKVGEGSTFTVCFPIVRPVSPADDGSPTKAPPASQTPTTG